MVFAGNTGIGIGANSFATYPHLAFKIDNNRDYKSLSSLLTHKESTIDMTSIVNQWDRMAHFYGSITTGHVSASLAMRKLLSFNSKNEFYKGTMDF